VTTHHRSWIKKLQKQPDLYEAVPGFTKEEEGFVVFKVKRPSSLFLKGSGTVTADFNKLSVELDDPQGECVIKYNWSEDLAAQPPAKLFPFDAGNGIKLIGIRPGGTTQVKIGRRG
jgi:hypothetical protein